MEFFCFGLLFDGGRSCCLVCLEVICLVCVDEVGVML